MSITVKNVSHRYGDTPVLEDVSLSVGAGEILCLLGPSGSGKSTLLKLLAGLEPLQSGEIWLGDQVVTPDVSSPPEDRSVGLVFQQHALFPHLTVEANVGFGLKALDQTSRQSRVNELIQQVSLEGLGERYPQTLSGGQQQRVAIARALAPSPGLMLMDEPFANVDMHLSQQLREDTRRSLREQCATTVIVTHDAEEALDVADYLAVLVDGRIVQAGTPDELWQAPAHRFIAETIRGMQCLDGVVREGSVETAFGALPYPNELPEAGTPVTVALDAHAVGLRSDPESAVCVDDIRSLGSEFQVLVRAGRESLRLRSVSRPDFGEGVPVSLDFADTDRFLYY